MTKEEQEAVKARGLNRLFVYGIFLGDTMRRSYGMENPRYATVKNFVTVGSHIVQAVKVDAASGVALTGLIVELPEDYNWGPLDALEGGYDRIIVRTESGDEAYMYATPGTPSR